MSCWNLFQGEKTGIRLCYILLYLFRHSSCLQPSGMPVEAWGIEATKLNKNHKESFWWPINYLLTQSLQYYIKKNNNNIYLLFLNFSYYKIHITHTCSSCNNIWNADWWSFRKRFSQRLKSCSYFIFLYLMARNNIITRNKQRRQAPHNNNNNTTILFFYALAVKRLATLMQEITSKC